MKEKLYLSKEDKKVMGVCGGLGEYFDIDSSIIRIIFILLLIFVEGPFFITYFIIGAILPNKPYRKSNEESEERKESISEEANEEVNEEANEEVNEKINEQVNNEENKDK